MLGLLGALDPYKFRMLSGEMDSKSSAGSSQEITATEQGKNLWQSLSNLCNAINFLLKTHGKVRIQAFDCVSSNFHTITTFLSCFSWVFVSYVY